MLNHIYLKRLKINEPKKRKSGHIFFFQRRLFLYIDIGIETSTNRSQVDRSDVRNADVN